MKHSPWTGVAFVTGAGSGIGRALCVELSRRGAVVAATDLNLESAKETVGMLKGQGLALKLDVADRQAFKKCVQTVEKKLGPLNFIANNAGIGIAGEVLDLKPEDWERTFAINVMGVVHGIDAAYPGMAERRRGFILNTASLAGLTAVPGGAPYCASKHAVVGLTLSLRAEAQTRKVKVSALCPGIVDTPIFANSISRGGLDARQLPEITNFKALAPEECAKAALDGLAKGEPLIVVPAIAQTAFMLQRISPNLMTLVSNNMFDRQKKALIPKP